MLVPIIYFGQFVSLNAPVEMERFFYLNLFITFEEMVIFFLLIFGVASMVFTIIASPVNSDSVHRGVSLLIRNREFLVQNWIRKNLYNLNRNPQPNMHGFLFFFFHCTKEFNNTVIFFAIKIAQHFYTSFTVVKLHTTSN